MQEPQNNEEPIEQPETKPQEPSLLFNPKTKRPFDAPDPNAQTTVVVPINQSSVVIPKAELEALKRMSRNDKRIWAARKKKLLGGIIDQYIQQAILSTNGKTTL